MLSHNLQWLFNSLYCIVSLKLKMNGPSPRLFSFRVLKGIYAWPRGVNPSDKKISFFTTCPKTLIITRSPKNRTTWESLFLLSVSCPMRKTCYMLKILPVSYSLFGLMLQLPIVMLPLARSQIGRLVIQLTRCQSWIQKISKYEIINS